MEPVKNYNIPVTTFIFLNAEEKESLDKLMEEINCTYTITE